MVDKEQFDNFHEVWGSWATEWLHPLIKLLADLRILANKENNRREFLGGYSFLCSV